MFKQVSDERMSESDTRDMVPLQDFAISFMTALCTDGIGMGASGEAVELRKYKHRSRTDVSLSMTAQLCLLEASAQVYEVKLDQGRRKMRHGSASAHARNVWRERADSNVSTIMDRCTGGEPALTFTTRSHKRGNALPENAAKERGGMLA